MRIWNRPSHYKGLPCNFCLFSHFCQYVYGQSFRLTPVTSPFSTLAQWNIMVKGANTILSVSDLPYIVPNNRKLTALAKWRRLTAELLICSGKVIRAELGFAVGSDHRLSDACFDDGVFRSKPYKRLRRTLFDWTKRDKMCKFSRKSSFLSYVQHKNRKQTITSLNSPPSN